MDTVYAPTKKQGVKVVRDMVANRIVTQYRLAKEMGVTTNAVQDWLLGKYFDEDKHLPHLLQVREKYMKAKGLGIWS